MVRVMTETFKDEVAALGDPSRPSAILADLDGRTPALNALARKLLSGLLALV